VTVVLGAAIAFTQYRVQQQDDVLQSYQAATAAHINEEVTATPIIARQAFNGQICSFISICKQSYRSSLTANGAKRLSTIVRSAALFSASRQAAPARGSCCGGRRFASTALRCSRRGRAA
jgi:hypothetical protein